ncbi:hypothetical protein CPAV1605_471 [seawater metagenome]|uniref:Uncharacterized protein n=1 Tax=seawater metagenome TaxID=1561972 RepID=A0A5E8CI39_9ZZZZ
MTKYNSSDLTLKDVEAIDSMGAAEAARKFHISLNLAQRCEKILKEKIQLGGGSKKSSGSRKLSKSNNSSESDMKDLLNDSSEQSEVDNKSQGNTQMQNMQQMQFMNNPQQMMNPYDQSFNLQNMQAPNFNPATNQTMPNLTSNGSNPLTPITNNDVMGQMVNNPNPNIFNTQVVNQASSLPPKPDKVDPLMVNHIAPVVTADKALGYLKNLNGA